MALKFRKRIKIAPGVNLNLSKGGISASVGKPGATVNIGKKGVKTTVGIPGSGISWSTTSNYGSRDAETGAHEKLGFWQTLGGLIDGVFLIIKSVVMLAIGCFVLWILLKILGAIFFS
ncbi:DUF4236 domain-containing protein [Aeromonas jandaei]|nr:DUF4236 domain-containing protein [Aeromonas jandaei]